ncbi:condensation domain-containing protein [Allokutzneria sp. A3M-2-11 16]|uniref:condensation domain-containing protein n=1 Tax=Allokutzneria sp. A3M-2-11 16 TaxID=2962043 RepID=UPI0020B79D0A|nr:condensation domain-containing protein [Allokutzneria sp. A3M-2-11 16]MCP3803847.1 condensation domain-containing protein [Allokutzneria sp. A3M-2-11 16]
MSDLTAVGELVDRGVELWTEDGELCFLAPPGVFTDSARTVLRAARAELISLLEGGKRLAPALLIERGRVDERFAEAPAGVRTLSFALHGPPDRAALEAALTELVARHEVLRTAYVRLHGFARLIHPPCPVPLVPGSQPPRPHASRPPLLTAALSDDHVLTLTVHGTAVDGMSLALLMEELGPLYKGASLPQPPSAQHQVRRERAYLASPEAQAAQRYWRQRLADSVGLPLLSTPGKPESVPVTVPPELARTVRARAAAAGTTPFTVLLAAFGQVLAEATGATDMTVAVPVAHRWHAEDELTVSGARDLLLLRLQLDSGDPVGVVHRERVNAMDHGRLPFEALPADVAPPRAPGRHPVFGVQFALQGFGSRLAPDLLGARLLDLPSAPLGEGMDCGLMLWDSAGGGYVGELTCDGAVITGLGGVRGRYLELVAGA